MIFLPELPFDIVQINKGIKPITVNKINNHHPDLFTSCNLLTPTARPDKKIMTVSTIPSGPYNFSYSSRWGNFIPTKFIR